MSLVNRISDAVRAFRAPQTTSIAAPAVQKDMGSLAFPSSTMMYAMGLFPSDTGAAVSPVAALQSATVYACCSRLASDMGKIDLKIRKRSPRGGWRDVPDHPLIPLFRKPNSYQTQFELFSYLVTALNLRGNGYMYADRRSDGTVRRLVGLMPERVAILQSPEGGYYYNITAPLLGSASQFATSEDIVHVRNLSIDGGVLGLSPIACSQNSVGLSLSSQKHAALFFRHGTSLSGVLQAPNRLSEEAAKRLAQSWQANYSGNDAHHRVAVLEDGIAFEPISIAPEDSQMIESMRWSSEEICRIFGIPGWLVGVPITTGTYANIESAQLSYVSNTLSSLAARIEQELERVLLFDDERADFQIRFDFESLLRGDSKSRYESYQIGLLNGILSIDEVRAKEGMEALPNDTGQEHRIPLNTGPAATKPSDTTPEADVSVAPKQPEAVA